MPLVSSVRVLVCVLVCLAATLPVRAGSPQARPGGAGVLLASAGQTRTRCDPALDIIEDRELPRPRDVKDDGELSAPLGGWLASPERWPGYGEVILVNGILTGPEEAHREAASTGDRLGVGVSLVYNAEAWTLVDLMMALWEKVCPPGWSCNAATRSVLEEIRIRIDAGERVRLIGYSEGALCVSNALRAYDAELRRDPRISDAERAARLGSIHVLTVGGAMFDESHLLADGWPAGLATVFHLYHENDMVANVLGPGRLWNWPTSFRRDHDYLTAHVQLIEPWMLTQSGSRVIGED